MFVRRPLGDARSRSLEAGEPIAEAIFILKRGSKLPVIPTFPALACAGPRSLYLDRQTPEPRAGALRPRYRDEGEMFC